MALKLKISHQLSDLIIELSNSFQNQEYDSVLTPSVFITQTDGMNKWMALQLSSKLGVFTNYKFFKPNTFLSDIFRLAGVVDEHDFSTEKLRWVIYDIFDEEEFKERFQDLVTYYDQDDVKRLQLATRVADLYDQYLIYRPDYIDIWNDEKNTEGVHISQERLKFHEEWQRYVWKKLKHRDNFEDKVDLRRKLKESFNDPEFIIRLKQKFRVVNILVYQFLLNFTLIYSPN